MQALNREQFYELHRNGHTIIDTRRASAFAAAFVSDSLNAGLGPYFTELLKEVTLKDQALLFICEAADSADLEAALQETGHHNIGGYAPYDTVAPDQTARDLVISVSAEEMGISVRLDDPNVLDIRPAELYKQEHHESARRVTFAQLKDEAFREELGKHSVYYFISSEGTRAMCAVSFMKARGYHNFYQVAGGFEALKQEKGVKTVKAKATKKG